MKLPRGVSGERLIRVLRQAGCAIVRKSGSHVRLQHEGPPHHSVTVPLHNTLKLGTLHGILAEVAQMRSTTVDPFGRGPLTSADYPFVVDEQNPANRTFRPRQWTVAQAVSIVNPTIPAA